MSDIKVKERASIKILDKAKIGTTKVKDNIIAINKKTDSTDNQYNNPEEYATEQIQEKSQNITKKAINRVDNFGRKSVKNIDENVEKLKDNYNVIKQNVQKAKNQIYNQINKNISNKVKGSIKTKENVRKVNKLIKNNAKATKRSIDTSKKAIKTSQNVVKTAEKTAKVTAKTAQKTARAVKAAAKASAKATKATIKAVIATIKVIISSIKGLIAFLIAGGWIAVVIILVICMIGLLINSIFGIFFTNEYESNSKSMSELNTEFMNKISTIQKDNPHDEYDITGSRADWKDILAVYVAKYSNGNYQTEMMSLDDKKMEELKKIFWDMNEITFTKDTWTEQKTILHLTWTEHKTIEHTKLHIKITSKNAQQMADQYLFNQNTRKVMDELLKDDFISMWSSVIYGSTGSTDIVEVARSQIGNVGGQPYWSWYGFNSRVEWCATFVSWCANECGYIDAGIIPKFAGCEAEGVAWFQACGLWQEKGYVPKSGDIIFFDWADKHDGHADHVRHCR